MAADADDGMDQMTREDAIERLKRVIVLGELCDTAEDRWEQDKKATRESKAHYEQRKEALKKARKESKEVNLFQPGVVVTDGDRDRILRNANLAAGGVKPEQASEPMAWRLVKTETLGLSEKIVAALKDHQPGGKSANLDTLGGLCEFQSADKRFGDVKGIGKAAVQKIEDAIQKWFADNPNATREELPPDAPAQDAEALNAAPADGVQPVGIGDAVGDDMTAEERAEAQHEAAAEAGEKEGDEG